MRRSRGASACVILDRITAILEAVADSPDPLPPAVIARTLNLPLPTVSRLTRELASRRYLQLEERSNCYSLGSRSLAWGYAARPARLMTTIVPEMERLRDATGETVSLHVRSNDLRVCIAEVQSLESVRRVVQLGWSFLCTSERQGASSWRSHCPISSRLIWRSWDCADSGAGSAKGARANS